MYPSYRLSRNTVKVVVDDFCFCFVLTGIRFESRMVPYIMMFYSVHHIDLRVQYFI
jgi:hypothetical protein